MDLDGAEDQPGPPQPGKSSFQELLPKQGILYQEDLPVTVLCKPKLMPLKSVTLEKLGELYTYITDNANTNKQQIHMSKYKLLLI